MLIASQQGGGLPSGYTALNWIQQTNDANNTTLSSGVPFLSIPVGDFTNKQLRVVCEIPQLVGQNGITLYSGFTRLIALSPYINGNIAYLYNSTWKITDVTTVANHEYDLKWGGNGGFVDGVYKVNADSVTFPSNADIFTGYKSNNEVWYGTILKIKLIQVLSADDTVLFNGVPCLDNNNEPCLYDTVGKLTHYKTRTSSRNFLYG